MIQPPAKPASPKASWGFAEGDLVAPAQRAIRRLGGGAVFEVYVTRDENRIADVVCKLVRPDQVSDAGALRQLRRESRLLDRLSHPAIIRRLGATLVGPRPHLLLEHVDKITLRRRIRRRGPLSPARVLPLALRLGAALHYLAVEGVVHLDLKPSNVLLGPQPRLIDFSVARSLERTDRIRRPIGTAAYMSPEQCAPGERGAIGPAADIWGLGITLYEAVTGELPFPRRAGGGGSGALARYPQLGAEARPIAGGLPAAFSAIVMRCLAREPSARPTAAELVATLKPLAVASG